MTLGEKKPPNLCMMSDLRNEVRALDEARHQGRLEKSGNWTLDECCQHLGRWIEFSIDGFPFKYPWRYRLFGRLVRLWSWMWLVSLATRPGFRNPPSVKAVEPDQEIPEGAGVSYLLQQLDRIDAGERMMQPSPVEGPITHEQWWYFHLQHAKLHLSFQHDQRNESGSNPEEIIDIELRVCHNESSRPATESIEAIRLCPHQFRLLYSPGLVEGVAKGDVIEFSDTDPKGFTVVSRAGYFSVWFYFKEQGRNQGPDGDRVRAAVEKFGGICDGGGNTNLVFSVPVSFRFPAVEALFNDLVGQYPGSAWLFGNVYDPWNDFKPLGWWDKRE
jgi:Protein of unknown function (DUF1569)/Domain of unknown function (DUF4265)